MSCSPFQSQILLRGTFGLRLKGQRAYRLNLLHTIFFLVTDVDDRIQFPALPGSLSSGGPLSLVSRIETLLERKSSGSGLERREYGRRDSSRLARDTSSSWLIFDPEGGCKFLGTVSLFSRGYTALYPQTEIPQKYGLFENRENRTLFLHKTDEGKGRGNKPQND
jgi:hypothetical protein